MSVDSELIAKMLRDERLLPTELITVIYELTGWPKAPPALL